ncbi:DUF4179 domain-containing protein [Desulfoscipio gibsoniae]|uniref:DUF4179 domain-containing protein n=1 Tax=Desulfoscipio gibsoniae DSM 7213 TaxID=767817 RepID=R4KH66_9FIRM|nr:DUF4179 domain-containing protein [Desulfoscipio gibsoniae]AGL02518.1 hypothetical protein Desgi_3163 [Desulfoscipio gibsoniae DSM 7213]
MTGLENKIREVLHISFMHEEPSTRLKEKTITALNQICRPERSKNKKFTRWAVAFAIIFAFVFSVNLFPSFAETVGKIPLISNLVELIQFDKGMHAIRERDKGVEEAIRSGYGANINKTAISNGISFTIDNVIPDQKRMLISFSVELDEEKYKDVKSLWFNNMTLSDDQGQIIVRIKDGQMDLATIQENNWISKWIIGPGEGQEGSMDRSGTLAGWMEVVNQGQTGEFPSTITMDINGFRDATHSSGHESTKIIAGEWKVAFSVSSSLANAKPLIYEGKDFVIKKGGYDLVLKLDYVKVYPTVTSLKIDVVEKKSAPYPGFFYEMHLEDETGRIYKHMDDEILTDSGNVRSQFESAYFTKPKELYWVIESLSSHDPETQIEEVTPVNMRVKIY